MKKKTATILHHIFYPHRIPCFFCKSAFLLACHGVGSAHSMPPPYDANQAIEVIAQTCYKAFTLAGRLFYGWSNRLRKRGRRLSPAYPYNEVHTRNALIGLLSASMTSLLRLPHERPCRSPRRVFIESEHKESLWTR